MKTLHELGQRAASTVKHWWLMLLAGIASIAVGIVVFCYPAESYLTLSILFGILMLLSGITEVALYFSSRSIFVRSGVDLLCGIFDLLLGLWLAVNPAVSAVMMPIMLGIWLMMRSIQMINFWSRMRAFEVKGAGWQVCFGILLLLLSFAVMFNPLSWGTSAIVALLGCGFLFAGCALTLTSLRLRNIHNFVKQNILEDVEYEEVK